MSRKYLSGVAIANVDYYCVLDFEAKWDLELINGVEKSVNYEIIEFPVVLLNAKTLVVEGEFHQYVKPTVNPKVSQYVTDLTNITQQQTDSSKTLPEVLNDLDLWRRKHRLGNDFAEGCFTFAFVTCGDWDLCQMLPRQLISLNILKPKYFDNWINLKAEFQQFYKKRNQCGMAEMLAVLQMPLIGHHHSGIDDARNIAAITIHMLKSNAKLCYSFKCPAAVTAEAVEPATKSKLSMSEAPIKSEAVVASEEESSLQKKKKTGKMVLSSMPPLQKNTGIGWGSAPASSSRQEKICFQQRESCSTVIPTAVTSFVVHCKKSKYDVYIGRKNPTIPLSADECKWGNPFVVGKHGNREEVCAKYENWLMQQPELIHEVQTQLKGKVLGCWCSPQLCHGHVLARVANCMAEK